MNSTSKVNVGTIRLIKNQWHFLPNSAVEDILPIYKFDNELAEKINSMSSGGEYMRVEAYKVEEFTHPELFTEFAWGEGTPCWKLIEPKDLYL